VVDAEREGSGGRGARHAGPDPLRGAGGEQRGQDESGDRDGDGDGIAEIGRVDGGQHSGGGRGLPGPPPATRAAETHAALERLEESLEWGDNGLAVYGRLALEYGLRQSAMQEEWARWAAAQVETLSAAPARSGGTEGRGGAERSDPAD